MSAPIPMPEENLIFAKERLDRIKAIADTLTTLERNGYTDELYEGSLHHLMALSTVWSRKERNCSSIERRKRFLKISRKLLSLARHRAGLFLWVRVPPRRTRKRIRIR